MAISKGACVLCLKLLKVPQDFTCETGPNQINDLYTIVSDEGGSCLTDAQVNRKQWINYV